MKGRTTLVISAAYTAGRGAWAAILLLFLRVVLLHHVAADISARGAWTIARARGRARCFASAVWRIRVAGWRDIVAERLPRRAIAFSGFFATMLLLIVFTHIHSVVPAMVVMGLASFASDLTMPISWDTCVEIGGAYTATVAATMNMLGNLAGFVAPVLGGVILQRAGTGPNGWNLLIDTMAVAAAASAACWLYSIRNRRGGSGHAY